MPDHLAVHTTELLDEPPLPIQLGTLSGGQAVAGCHMDADELTTGPARHARRPPDERGAARCPRDADHHPLARLPCFFDALLGQVVLQRLLDAVGEMDERYFLYSEEVDWCLRSRELGWRLGFAPRSIVWHKGGQSVGYSSPLHDYHTTRGMLLVVHRFYPHLLPLAIGYSLFRCLAPKIVRLELTRFRAVMRAYSDLLLLRPARAMPGAKREATGEGGAVLPAPGTAGS
jgi:GT2 family glycosyltransferase